MDIEYTLPRLLVRDKSGEVHRFLPMPPVLPSVGDRLIYHHPTRGALCMVVQGVDWIVEQTPCLIARVHVEEEAGE